MNLATREALDKTGLGWKDINWFVPHQANLRINEAVAQYAEIPPEKILNSIQKYGNTTAASVPLTIDHHRKPGTVKKGTSSSRPSSAPGSPGQTAVFRI